MNMIGVPLQDCEGDVVKHALSSSMRCSPPRGFRKAPEPPSRVGLPYLGYVVANIPSSIIVTRVGAPVWLACLMLSWGIVCACTAAVRTRAQFFLIRVLLGVTEAGCFPGASIAVVV